MCFLVVQLVERPPRRRGQRRGRKRRASRFQSRAWLERVCISFRQLFLPSLARSFVRRSFNLVTRTRVLYSAGSVLFVSRRSRDRFFLTIDWKSLSVHAVCETTLVRCRRRLSLTLASEERIRHARRRELFDERSLARAIARLLVRRRARTRSSRLHRLEEDEKKRERLDGLTGRTTPAFLFFLRCSQVFDDETRAIERATHSRLTRNRGE